ncbi:MAG: 4a-hydroxytetrahydrobiopterin dehydratase [Flavobacteriaceae bacterium]
MKKLTEHSIEERLLKLDGWEYKKAALEASFTFENFTETFSVMTRIAFECEAQGHHPNWSNVYNTLNIRLNTHDVGGVTEKDFELAHAIEKVTKSK